MNQPVRQAFQRTACTFFQDVPRFPVPILPIVYYSTAWNTRRGYVCFTKIGKLYNERGSRFLETRTLRVYRNVCGHRYALVWFDGWLIFPPRDPEIRENNFELGKHSQKQAFLQLYSVGTWACAVDTALARVLSIWHESNCRDTFNYVWYNNTRDETVE